MIVITPAEIPSAGTEMDDVTLPVIEGSLTMILETSMDPPSIAEGPKTVSAESDSEKSEDIDIEVLGPKGGRGLPKAGCKVGAGEVRVVPESAVSGCEVMDTVAE